jgi:hypothetical protein
MRLGRVHCQVVEVPTFSPTGRSAERCCRDLLPWADPYIAALMTKLQAECASQDISENSSHPNDGDCCYSAAEDVWLEDDERTLDPVDDLPSHLDFPPVVGGWPLLNDDVSEEEPC